MALDKEDCTCPICMYIMIEPVTMPCKHSLCMPCYKQTVEKANLCCPICRLRISVWARRASKTNSLVDNAKWDAIRSLFPEQVQNRLEGKENLDDVLDDTDDYETQLRRLKELSKPGEIRQEYETALLKLQHQREQEAKVEEEASAALIKALQQEEEREMENLDKVREELDKMDQEIAEQLQESFEIDAAIAEPETSTKSLILSSGVSKATSGNKKGKTKQVKQPVNNNLTMTTFFSPVSRADVTDTKHKNEFRSHDVGSSRADAGPSLHISLCDKLVHKQSNEVLTSEADNSVEEVSRKSKNLDSSLSTTASDLTVERSGLNSQKMNTWSTEQSFLNIEPQDKFIAGPSGLGTSHFVGVETLKTLTSLSEKNTHLVRNASHHVRLTGPGHTKMQFQPFVKCTKMLSEQQLASGSDSDSSHVLTETGNSVTSKIKTISSSASISSTKGFRSFQLFNLNTINKIPDVNGCILTPQDQCVQKVSKCDVSHGHVSVLSFENSAAEVTKTCTESNKSMRHVSVLSFENSAAEVTKTCTESNKSMRQSQDLGIADHNTTFTSLALIPEIDSDSKQRISCDEACEGHSEKESKSLMHLVSATSTDRPAIDKEMKDLRTDKPICLLPGSDESANKDIVNGLINCDNFSIQSDDNGTVIPVPCDVTNNDSDRSCDNDEYSIAADGDSCAPVPSRSSLSTTEKFANHSKMCLPNTEAVHNPEKENSIVEIDMQNNNKRTNSEIEHGQNAPLKTFNNKKLMHKTGMSKNSTVSSFNRENASIVRWCVSGSSKDELEGSSLHKDDVFTGKTFAGHNKSKNVRGYSLKRKCSCCDDENEHKAYNTKQMPDVPKCTKDSVINIENDISSIAGKVSKNDKDTDRSSSNLQAASLGDLCLDEADLKGMSQEERDHLLALKLQEMYTKLDKQNIVVDRFKGSKDQYQLRKKRKITK